jgi:hypothetical protein
MWGELAILVLGGISLLIHYGYVHGCHGKHGKTAR